MVKNPEALDSLPRTVQLPMLLVLLRWLVWVVVGLLLWFRPVPARLSPIVSFSLLGIYNLPLSYLLWKRLPEVAHHRWGFILVEGAVSLALLPFTGGFLSPLFLFVLVVVAEISLFFPWKTAFSLILVLDGFQTGASLLPGAGAIDPIAVLNRFTALLLFGGFASLFAELLRQEERERRKLAQMAEREHALNEIFVQLGQSRMQLDRVLQVILENAQRLMKSDCVVILLREGKTLRVVRSLDPYCTPEQGFPAWSRLPRESGVVQFYRTWGPWPPFVQNPGIRQVAIAPLTAPGRETVGWLVVGYATERPLEPVERSLLQALALEASLGISNARMYQREQAHVKELQRFEHLRSTFFSALAHELKTPLTILKTLVFSLDQFGQWPEETRGEVLETLKANLQRLETLISEALESAKLESRTVHLHRNVLALVPRIQRTLQRLDPVFRRRNLRVVTELPEAPLEVYADPRRLDQILENLLENAAKFSPAGGAIRVRVTSGDREVRICIADQGPGVPEELRHRIFEKFYRAHPGEGGGGMGLGLFITRELVTLHGGRIWVQPADLGGSEFCFTLPVHHENAGTA